MRPAFALLALPLVAASCGSASPRLVDAPPPPPKATAFAGGVLTPPRAAPPLSLKDSSGRRITLTGRRGSYVLVTFLYTHCPDVCPLIASNLNTVLRSTGNKSKVDVIAVSVDPKGDTASSVRAYAKRLHLEPRFHYLIGSRADLRRVWAAWDVRSVSAGPNLVGHTSYTALVDTRGRERVIYDARVTAQQVLHDLQMLKRSAA